MKKLKIYFPILTLFISSFVFAQDKGDIITLDVPTAKSNVQSLISGQTTTNDADFLETGIKYKVISKSDNTVQLQALNFDKLTAKEKTDYQTKYGVAKKDLSEIYNNKIYTISRSDFDANANKFEPKERLSIGLLTLPFKARPQGDFSFDTEFNLNSTLNWSFAYTNNVSINLQVGAGIGTVGLNTSNSSGLSDNEAQDVSTITFMSGLMLQYKKVQAGIYIGVDNINNQSNYQWESNGNMWFGFGIGYDLFNLTLASESNKQ
ncbi:hypothetical protein [Joostella sp.]|uniref:hypothetical protein n=1 Tax=Joostella sp. TaxID=2231138 RepID=UPI003A90F1EC